MGSFKNSYQEDCLLKKKKEKKGLSPMRVHREEAKRESYRIETDDIDLHSEDLFSTGQS